MPPPTIATYRVGVKADCDVIVDQHFHKRALFGVVVVEYLFMVGLDVK